MLEKPEFPDEKLIAAMQDDFGLQIEQLAFLPLGGDLSTAVYRATADDSTPYFLKLRRGEFDETSVALPRFLSDQGIAEIIPPLRTRSGMLWADLDDFKLILYPFVEGVEGYTVELTERQWADFGAALKRLHTTTAPPAILQNIDVETYSPYWRDGCRRIMQRLDQETFDDPLQAAMAALLQSKREMILDALERAEHLAQVMASRDIEFVLCHSDIHPGNLFLDPQGTLFIVDWDYPMFAPKERDLMFIGGGQGFMSYDAEQEERLFYRGYGPTEPDFVALAYYRYERAIMDITVESERILADAVGSEDSARSLEYLGYYFLPGCTFEMAVKADHTR